MSKVSNRKVVAPSLNELFSKNGLPDGLIKKITRSGYVFVHDGYFEGLVWLYRYHGHGGDVLRGMLEISALYFLERKLKKEGHLMNGKWEIPRKYTDLDQIAVAEQVVKKVMSDISEGKHDQFDTSGDLILDNGGQPVIRNIAALIRKSINYKLATKIGQHRDRVTAYELETSAVDKTDQNIDKGREAIAQAEEMVKVSSPGLESDSNRISLKDPSQNSYEQEFNAVEMADPVTNEKQATKMVNYGKKIQKKAGSVAGIFEVLKAEAMASAPTVEELMVDDELMNATIECLKELTDTQKTYLMCMAVGLQQNTTADLFDKQNINEPLRNARERMSLCLERKGFVGN